MYAVYNTCIDIFSRLRVSDFDKQRALCAKPLVGLQSFVILFEIQSWDSRPGDQRSC